MDSDTGWREKASCGMLHAGSTSAQGHISELQRRNCKRRGRLLWSKQGRGGQGPRKRHELCCSRAEQQGQAGGILSGRLAPKTATLSASSSSRRAPPARGHGAISAVPTRLPACRATSGKSGSGLACSGSRVLGPAMRRSLHPPAPKSDAAPGAEGQRPGAADVAVVAWGC